MRLQLKLKYIRKTIENDPNCESAKRHSYMSGCHIIARAQPAPVGVRLSKKEQIKMGKFTCMAEFLVSVFLEENVKNEKP